VDPVVAKLVFLCQGIKHRVGKSVVTLRSGDPFREWVVDVGWVVPVFANLAVAQMVRGAQQLGGF
jgi:hypothetical protein